MSEQYVHCKHLLLYWDHADAARDCSKIVSGCPSLAGRAYTVNLLRRASQTRLHTVMVLRLCGR